MGTKAVQRGEVAERVSRSVRVRRTDLGLSQLELAERLAAQGRPMQVTAVSKIESGDRRVDVDDLVALSAALRLEPAQLLSGDVTDVRSRELSDHDDALAPVLLAARVARDATGLGYRAIANYLMLVGPTSDLIGEHIAKKAAKEARRGKRR